MTATNLQNPQNSSDIISLSKAELDQWFDERLEQKLTERDENKTPSMSIIATKGTMDWAYPPFILASTAAALGWEVSVFFTFYGLSLLKKNLDLEVSPLGNPAMPMKMPFGPQWLQNIDMNIPNALMGNIPGFEKMATAMMKKTTKNKGIASVEELRGLCIEAEVKLVACLMTVDMFGYDKSEFIPEVKDWIGAASFLPVAQKSDVSLFI
ncbi:MAG: DsrE/DsrF/DrsH-like family protein [Gammaproteobacteria bacterium]|nr:DsrE/DsrF/DrsH-like family protein [Gammaproteobacteria bacterium]MCW8909610.1 DsrE/DsrF/DrsH-like family protein [Gammaproteobacteria bacterium]MCW9005227.1 DsrE/DsrF/DrsH-like family protein [Gammaproteobacteria bacterium]MCW9055817.1 DsrE/DsrF/DrsH-like family protein [Gammaproteobacteria bacterium]